jgi:hypothetical protein
LQRQSCSKTNLASAGFIGAGYSLGKTRTIKSERALFLLNFRSFTAAVFFSYSSILLSPMIFVEK